MGNLMTNLSGFEEKAKYRIYVATSWNYVEGKTKNSVHMEMVGENESSTGFFELKNNAGNNFERGKTDVFDIETKDVGMPLILRIELGKELADAWVCRDIVIQYKNEVARYPVHDWVTKEIYVTKARALTYTQVKIPALRLMRKNEVESKKQRFQWNDPPTDKDIGRGLPRFIKTDEKGQQPAFFLPTATRTKEVVEAGFVGAFNAARVTAEGFMDKLDTFEEYQKLYQFLQKEVEPPINKSRWQSDEEFGYQQMNGISPTSYERCKEIPENCQITSDHITDLLIEGKTLEEEMKAGKVYIADYSKVYQDAPRNKNMFGQPLYCPDAICLYYVDGKDNLVPIAIQLVPGDVDTIFTPKHSKEDWLLAKMYFQVAVGNMHQWYYHYLLTHNVMEPLAVSLFRCIPTSHPLYKLLRPHLQFVSSINNNARLTLVPKGSQANQAMSIVAEDQARRVFKDFNLNDLHIPQMLKKKGLDDSKLLPKNYYRDDATDLWKIIEEFVKSVIKHFYGSDEEVSKDEELQDWMKDAGHEGFGWEDGNTRGIPESTESVEELISFCTLLVFTCSVQHAAVNFAQYEHYKFIPNAPLAMRLPPHKKGEATMERIFNSLPDVYMSATTITLSYLLSTYSPDEAYIGQYPDSYFDEPETTMIIDNYKRNLSKFADKVKARNKDLERPYKWLLPEKIPNSIAI